METSETPETPSPRKPNWGLIAFTAALVVLLALIGGGMLYHRSLERRIAEARQAIRDAGFPATPAELDAWYPTPLPGRNAADDYLAAIAGFRRDPVLEGELPTIGTHSDVELLKVMEAYPPRRLEAGKKYLALNRASLDIVMSAVKKEESRYTVDFRLQKHPQLIGCRMLARFMRLAVEISAEEQTFQEAGERWIAMLKIADSLKREPALAAAVVRLANGALANQVLERLLVRFQMDEPTLLSMGDALIAFEQDTPQTFERAWIGERTMVTENPIGRPNPNSFFARINGQRLRDELGGIQAYNDGLAIHRLPTHEWLGQFETTIARISVGKSSLNAYDGLFTTVHAISRTELQFRAGCRVRYTAIAIERYRLAHGKLPATLSDFVPRFLPVIPTDPFDGRELRYKPTPTGYCVYSIGHDGIDNGGTRYDKHGSEFRDDTDIALTIER